MPDDEGHPTVAELEAHRSLLNKIIDEAIGMRAAIEEQLRAVRQDSVAKIKSPPGPKKTR
jgi:hypothetical protein